MNGIGNNKRLEWKLRRPLTPQEEAEMEGYLRLHPEERRDWEEDLHLNDLLRRLPNPRVSSNFTSRVVSAALLESEKRPWHRRLPIFARLPRWVPRAAIASAVLALSTVSYFQYQTSVRLERAQSVATVSRMATLPSLEALQDFEAIHRLSHVPEDPDLDYLLAALQ